MGKAEEFYDCQQRQPPLQDQPLVTDESRQGRRRRQDYPQRAGGGVRASASNDGPASGLPRHTEDASDDGESQDQQGLGHGAARDQEHSPLASLLILAVALGSGLLASRHSPVKGVDELAVESAAVESDEVSAGLRTGQGAPASARTPGGCIGRTMRWPGDGTEFVVDGECQCAGSSASSEQPNCGAAGAAGHATGKTLPDRPDFYFNQYYVPTRVEPPPSFAVLAGGGPVDRARPGQAAVVELEPHALIDFAPIESFAKHPSTAPAWARGLARTYAADSDDQWDAGGHEEGWWADDVWPLLDEEDFSSNFQVRYHTLHPCLVRRNLHTRMLAHARLRAPCERMFARRGFACIAPSSACPVQTRSNDSWTAIAPWPRALKPTDYLQWKSTAQQEQKRDQHSYEFAWSGPVDAYVRRPSMPEATSMVFPNRLSPRSLHSTELFEPGGAWKDMWLEEHSRDRSTRGDGVGGKRRQMRPRSVSVHSFLDFEAEKAWDDDGTTEPCEADDDEMDSSASGTIDPERVGVVRFTARHLALLDPCTAATSNAEALTEVMTKTTSRSLPRVP